MKPERLFDGSIFKERLSRRAFIRAAISGAMAISFFNMIPRKLQAAEKNFNGRAGKKIKGDYDLAIAKGDNPYAMTAKAVELMGGMEKFVKKGDVVVIKPNMGWDRSPAQAGNTNPEVVAALVDLSLKAGAKRVNIFDITCNDPKRCYDSSGIMQAAKDKGAQVYFPEDWNTVKAKFAYSSPMEGWPILKDAIECDTFINVPVLKHHALTRLTISMKNLMGVCGGNRGIMHFNIGRKLLDLTDFISPDLTIIDAYRVLVRNGPTGGNLADVEMRNRIIAATDPVLADTYAAFIMDVDPMSVPNIRAAADHRFGSTDIGNARKIEVAV